MPLLRQPLRESDHGATALSRQGMSVGGRRLLRDVPANACVGGVRDARVVGEGRVTMTEPMGCGRRPVDPGSDERRLKGLVVVGVGHWRTVRPMPDEAVRIGAASSQVLAQLLCHRRKQRHLAGDVVWRVAHPFDELTAVRIICWFDPDTQSAVVVLLGADKAAMGDVFYDSVGPRADHAIQIWRAERGTR